MVERAWRERLGIMNYKLWCYGVRYARNKERPGLDDDPGAKALMTRVITHVTASKYIILQSQHFLLI